MIQFLDRFKIFVFLNNLNMIEQKKVLKLFCFIVLLMFPMVCSIEMSIENDVYGPGETMNAQMMGNFIEFDINNIKIYEDGIPRLEPVINGLTKQNYVYHYYALLPRKEGNFTLVLENVKILENDRVVTKSFARNFSIVPKNGSSLSINPGFILLDSDNFKITVKSLVGNNDVQISLSKVGQSTQLFLIEGDEKIVDFTIDDLDLLDDSNLTVLTVNDYQIPVFIKSGLINKSNAGNHSVVELDDKILSITPNEVIGSGMPGKIFSMLIGLKNVGNLTIDSIRLTSNLIVDISPDEIKSLKKNQESVINISLLITPGTTEDIIGEVFLDSDGNRITLPIFIDVMVPYVNTTNSTNSTTIGYRCVDLGGLLCEFDETCDNNTTSSIDGPCCLGECTIKKATNSYNFVIGIVLIILLVLIIGYAYIKAKKNSRPKSSDDILKARKEKFRKRLNPEKPVEVDKSLSRE